MSWPLWLSFLVGALVVQIVPAPGMLFILANGISGAARRDCRCGRSGERDDRAYHRGCAWLGRRVPQRTSGLRHPENRRRRLPAVARAWPLPRRRARRRFRPGARSSDARRVFLWALRNNLSNPKVILFYPAFLPQFVTPHGASTALQLLLLEFAFLLIGLAIDLVLGSCAESGTGRTRERIRVVIDWAAGTILGALTRVRTHGIVASAREPARSLLHPRTISHLIGDEPVRLGFRFGSASRRSDSRSLGAPLATTMSCHRGRETSGLLSGPARSARWALLRGRSRPAIRCRSLSRAAAPCRLRPLRSRWRALSRRAPAARQGRAAGGSPRA